MTADEVQPHFADEYSQRLALSFRRAFPILCAVYLVLGMTDAGRFYFTIFSDIKSAQDETTNAIAGEVLRGWLRMAGIAGGLGIVAFFLLFQRRSWNTQQQVLAGTTLMIVCLGVVLLASRLVLQKLELYNNYAIWTIADFFVIHFLACLILPWTAKESAKPLLMLLLCWGLVLLLPGYQMGIFDRVVAFILSPMILLPGSAIAAWRVRRYEEDVERKMLGQQIKTIGGELSRARIIHDAMFPKPLTVGPVHFEYDYHPIAEIGGDYVHLHQCDQTGRVSMTLLDVAGHGLAAALTVNRLFGELERIRAEHPDAGPSDVMSLLNRYISLTMAHHDLYATGACIVLDPRTGDLEWVSAGHPPAFLRRSDGSVTDLPSTAVILGALDDEDFDPAPQNTRLQPGDTVIAYTDGAFEARDRTGRQFGLAALRETAAFTPAPRSWTRFISSAVAKHHEGHSEDDILIATLTLHSLHIQTMKSQAEQNQPPVEVDVESEAYPVQ